MILDTGTDQTMMSQRFIVQYQFNHIAIKVLYFRLTNSQTLHITHESTSFLVRLRETHLSFSGSIMPELNHNVISGMDRMRHNCPTLIGLNFVITIAQNGVRFQLYPAGIHKLTKDTVFVRLTENVVLTAKNVR